MSAQALVTVITVVRNGATYLHQALTSIIQQTYAPLEVIVVDGQSTDNTAAIARSFPGVQVVNQDQMGLANARNLGVAAAQGMYIAFLDHDDLWHPTKLARQIALHDSQPAAMYSLTQMVFLHEPGASLPPGVTPQSIREPRIAGTPSALVARKTLFDQMGGFNSKFSIACDADWFARTRDHDIPMAVIPETLVYKRLHGANLSYNAGLNRHEMFLVAYQSAVRQRQYADESNSSHS